MNEENINGAVFRDTELGILPKDWPEKFLDEVAERATGHTPDKKFPSYWNGTIHWVSLADSASLDLRSIDRTEKTITQAGIDNSSARLLPSETVILLRDASVGRCSLLAKPMAVSQHFVAWVCSAELNPLFLYYWLHSKRRHFERMAFGTTIVTIGMPFFKKLKVPIPPLPEQQKIAEILSTWDDAIEQTAALIEAKRQQKKALMQQLLTGHRRLPGFVGEWRRLLLRDTFGKELMIEKGAPLTAASLLPGSIPVVAGGQSYAYYHKFHTHTDPCITISASGAYAGYVWLHEQPIWASDCNVLTSKGADLHYIFHLLQFRQPEVYRLQTGGAQPHVYSRDLGRLILSLPELPEQRAIAAVLDAADKEIVSLEAKLEALRQQKKGLMQRLLTGQVRVKV
jgi:type I restriction enzyme S subunit